MELALPQALVATHAARIGPAWAEDPTAQSTS